MESKIYKFVARVIDILAIAIVIEWFFSILDITRINPNRSVLIDYLIIGLLFVELMYRLFNSNDKKQFMKEHYLEFIGLIPFIRIFRLFRVFRLIRKSKVSRFSKMVHDILRNNGLYYVILVVMVLTLIGGGLLFKYDDNIHSIADGIWFSFVTMTTVGYGDYVPASSAGRLVSVLLMIVGIGFIGILTGSLASFFTKYSKHQKTTELVNISDLSDEEKRQVMSYVDFIRSQK